MRIDWAQTLIGSHQGFGDQQNSSCDLGYAMRLGRIAGILASMVPLCLSMAVLPFFAPEMTLGFGLVLSGFLLAHAVGFVLLLRANPHDLRLPGLSTALALPFVAAANSSPGMILALMGLLLCEVFLQNRVRRNKELASWALPLFCLGFVMLARPMTGLDFMITLNALLPFSVMFLALLPVQPARSALIEQKDIRTQALLKVAMQRLPGTQILCDIMGVIEEKHAMAKAAFTPGEEEFGPSLMEAVLVVDRPPVLQALSRAVHAGETSAPFCIRVRKGGAGSMATGFTPHLCRVMPADGLDGHAIVVLEPVAAEKAGAGIAETGLVRGLHDAVSPFNVGLGYLEMLCDPVLTPEDPAVMRHYAGQARHAIEEAHRNSVIMGRWLRLMQRAGGDQPGPLALMALINDALRALNLTQDDIGLLIRGEREALVVTDEAAARFAMMVLLRAALSNRARGTSLCLGLIETEEGFCLKVNAGAEADMFQNALEEAAMGFGAFRFERAADHVAMIVRPSASARTMHSLRATTPAPLRMAGLQRAS